MSRARLSVVKVGGSLLANCDLPSRLRHWLDGEAAADRTTHFVLLAGGGELVDVVRDIDRRVSLDTESAHWICIDLLNITSQLLAARLPELDVVSDYSSLERRLHDPGATILCPSHFLRIVEPRCPGRRLASDWSVTSDSIAGRLAVVLAADEVVLLKSAIPPAELVEPDWLSRLASLGYVDSFFPMLAAELPRVRFVDLTQCPASVA